MPGLLSGNFDFGLDQDASNRQMVKKFHGYGVETLLADDRCRLLTIGDTKGSIGLIANEDDKLYYFVDFEVSVDNLTGGTVTQVVLWRHPMADLFLLDVTRTVFFDTLLPRHKAIMSDSLQTFDGRCFWQRMIALAYRRSLTIQLVDFRLQKIETFDPKISGSLVVWLRSFEAWGKEDRHEDLRLIIRA